MLGGVMIYRFTASVLSLLLGLLICCSSIFAWENWEGFFPINGINCMEQNENTIWAGTNGGLVAIDIETGERTIYTKTNSGLPSNTVNDIAIDNEGTVWIASGFTSMFGHEFGGLSSFDGTEWIHYSDDVFDFWITIDAVTVDVSGSVWIGFHNGIAKYDGEVWIAYNGDNLNIPLQEVYAITFDNNGILWARSGYEIYSFDGYEWSYYYLPDLLPCSGSAYGVKSLAADSTGTIWFSQLHSENDDLGLISYDGNSWSIYDTSNSNLPSNRIPFIEVAESGIVWLGTDSGLVSFQDQEMEVYNTANSGIINNNISSICAGDNGALWLGAGRDLCNYTDGVWAEYAVGSDWLQGTPVLASARTLNDVWIASYSSSWQTQIEHYNGINWEVYTSEDIGWTAGTITCLSFDHESNLWVGSDSAGLAVFDGVSWNAYNTHNSNIPSDEINDIKFDNNGEQILGTGVGIARFTGGNWNDYNPDQLLADGFDIHELVIDSTGTIWAWFDDNNWVLLNVVGDSVTVFEQIEFGSALEDIDLAIDSGGDLWALGGWVWNYDGVNWINIGETWEDSVPLPFTCMALDSDDVLWFGTGGCGMFGYSGSGIVAYKDGALSILDESNSPLTTNYISQINIDDQGNKWILSSHGPPFGVGIYIYTGELDMVSLDESGSMCPNSPLLLQNYPNPFNPVTTISYDLPESSNVMLTVYNIAGREVTTLLNKHQQTGSYNIQWNGVDYSGKQVSTGVYFARLQAGDYSKTIKMMHLK